MPTDDSAAMSDRHVLLVSDRPERAGRIADGIGLLMPCRVVGPGAALPSDAPIAYVLDLAPARGEPGPWRDALALRVRAGAAPCLYIVRGPRAPATDAARYGAPILIDREGGSGGVVAALLALTKQARPAPVLAPAIRVGRATGLVTGLFAAAGAGRAPSPREAEEGTSIVLDTVSEVGIREWLDLVWRHDTGVYQHALSVAGYAAAFGGALGLGTADLRRLTKAALLHDIGKARIPVAILNKPGALTEAEMAVMRGHAAIGADLLAATGDYEPVVVDVARFHHERLDGSGYPEGRGAEGIGDLVRLVMICDVHSALTERRVYREAMPAGRARAIMAGMSGKLDPDLLRVYEPILALGGAAVGAEPG